MADILVSNQTLYEFIQAPFGLMNKQKNLKYEDRYQAYKRSNKIKIEGTLELEKNYFIHIKVPSENTESDIYYDVVIQFFTSDSKIEKELSVSNYYVQFFSNSPGFVYRYAALYKLQGYLISSLYDKLSAESLDTLPTKANKMYEMYFDSSIYYACRYVLDNKLTALSKVNIKYFRNKSSNRFFSDIQDFESINISRNIDKTVSNIKKEIKEDTENSKNNDKLKKTNSKTYGKKEPIKAKKSTLSDSTSSIISKNKKITKKRATKSTVHKG